VHTEAVIFQVFFEKMQC